MALARSSSGSKSKHIGNDRFADWTTKLLGDDVKGRYADLKQTAADRCSRSLGTFVKRRKCSTITKSITNSSGICFRLGHPGRYSWPAAREIGCDTELAHAYGRNSSG